MAEARLQRLAPDSTPQEREVTLVAAHVLYGADLHQVHDSELKSLSGNAHLFIRHEVTTEHELRGFFKKSWGEEVSPLLGRLGYEALLPMGLVAGSKIPAPFTGLPIGFTVMGATTLTASMRDGVEARRYPALKTTGLPEPLQHRFDCYDRDMLPPGMRAEVTRQFVRAMVTLVPALHAMRTGEPLDLNTIVRNDVIADAVTFHVSENLDSAVQGALGLLKRGYQAVFQSAEKLKAQGVHAPRHEEIMAHQPKEVLEPRLKAYRSSFGQSVVDGVKGMGAGLFNLVRNQHGRVGVPINAAILIEMSLGMTNYLISKDPSNTGLPEGMVSARSALAVPATLIYMETLATAAFPTVLGICDAMSFKQSLQEMEPHDRVEELHEPQELGASVERLSIEPAPTDTAAQASTGMPGEHPSRVGQA